MMEVKEFFYGVSEARQEVVVPDIIDSDGAAAAVQPGAAPWAGPGKQV